MKFKMSVSVEEGLIYKIRDKIRADRSLKNKSQVVEAALRHFLVE